MADSDGALSSRELGRYLSRLHLSSSNDDAAAGFSAADVPDDCGGGTTALQVLKLVSGSLHAFLSAHPDCFTLDTKSWPADDGFGIYLADDFQFQSDSPHASSSRRSSSRSRARASPDSDSDDASDGISDLDSDSDLEDDEFSDDMETDNEFGSDSEDEFDLEGDKSEEAEEEAEEREAEEREAEEREAGIQQLSQLTVAELKLRLRDRGLSVTGNKATLVARLGDSGTGR